MIKQDFKILSISSELVPPLKLILCLIVVFSMFSCLELGEAIAINALILDPKNRIESVIGAGGINRIQVIGSEVTEVVGDESKYSLYWSNDWRNLFITPKTEVGETIDLSLILIGGQAQDMRLTVGDVTAQTIFLNPNKSASSSDTITVTTGTSNFSSHHSFNYSNPSLNKELKKEIASMMRAMIEDVKDKYYVNVFNRILVKNKEMLITQNKSYRYKDLSGAILNIKNLASKSISLEEEQVGNLFKNPIAVNLPTNLLMPKAKISAFVITKENGGRDDK